MLKPTPRSKTLPQRKTITDEYSPRSQFSTPRESEQEYPEQEEKEEEEEEEDYEEEIDDPADSRYDFLFNFSSLI